MKKRSQNNTKKKLKLKALALSAELDRGDHTEIAYKSGMSLTTVRETFSQACTHVNLKVVETTKKILQDRKQRIDAL